MIKKFLLALAVSFGIVIPALGGALFTTETTTPLFGTAAFTGVYGATFTATGTGTNLVATSVTGTIGIGDTVAGTGVPVGTKIVSQSSGSTGGAGTYVTDQVTTAIAASITDSSVSLHVSSLTGTIFVGQTIAGSGVTGTPKVVSQTSGAAGAAGVYVTSAAAQQVASEAMTGTAQTFTGAAHDMGASPTGPYDMVGCAAIVDQTGTLNLQTSTDGTTWFTQVTASLTANTWADANARIRARYARCTEADGSTAQGSNLVQFGATGN